MSRVICQLKDLENERSVVFEAWVRGEWRPCFAVGSRAGPVAYLNVCAHRNRPVVTDAEPFERGLVECRAHGAFYVPETGECVEGPCVGARLVQVPLDVRGNDVFVIDDDTVDDSIYDDAWTPSD